MPKCLSRKPIATKLLTFLILLALCSTEQSLAQTAGGVGASEPTFHVVRSVSGSKGSQQGGHYVIEDPRSTFYMPADKNVIVYFEWDGPLGKHHLEGYWKNPEGKTVVISDFDFESKDKRFGGYWSLNLTEGTSPGVWSLEARVDGEVTGSHTFQIVQAEKPASAESSAPQLLTPAQLYQRALAATVMIDKLSSSGDKISRGSGFLIGDGLVLTAFESVDGASSVLLQLPGGQHVQSDELIKWDRWHDWAILKVPITDTPKLTLEKSQTPAVGDRCLYLNVSTDGSRSIVDSDVTGINNYPKAGQRLILSYLSNPESVGSPLLSEFGNVVGIIAGTNVPGSSSLVGTRFNYSSMFRPGSVPRNLAVPTALVSLPTAAAQPVKFSDLMRQGEFVSPLLRQGFVGQGSLSRDLDNRPGVTPVAKGEQYEYSHKDQQCVVFIMWEPSEKLNSTTSVRLYDVDGALLMEGKPSKVSLQPNKISFSTWQIGLRGLSSGTYRVDVMLGDQPAWRSFFAIAD